MQVAILVEYALKRSMRHPHNEAYSSHFLRTLSGDFLEELNSLAPPELSLRHLELTLDSGRVPYSTSAVSALLPLKRPDFALFMRSALVLRWENKTDPLDFKLAMDENSEKLKVWSPLYYGELPYVIGGCCGGRIFQWLKLSPNSDNGKILSEAIAIEYYLGTLGGLAEFLHSIVLIHRLLQRLQEKLPRGVPVRIYKEIRRKDGTVVLGPDCVLKTVEGMDKDRVNLLRFVYKSIARCRYLIQLVGEIKTLRKSAILRLQPVGDPDARPRDLKQLENATHDMLHGLVALHKVGYTHRDLRWQNCIRVNVQGEWKWVIIDLEYAGVDGAKWEGVGLVEWDAGTLEDRNGEKSYTKGSDMYELGKLIVRWLDSSGGGFVDEQRMRNLGVKMQKERGEAAKMLEDMCSKDCVRCAKFNT